ncbi:uncharacterized protein [Procambarus clarkii]|uniref:uncharacterized protein n=1 Tax=Procambarus clarkii TaxID=6728 RepID=UPI0037438172
MSSSTEPSGDNRLNYARKVRFVMTIGQHIIYKVYLWLYQGGATPLFQYLETQTKKLTGFEGLEIEAIKNGHIQSMDIKLLYKVVQRTCGLASKDEAWYTKPISAKDMSLEQSLHKLKSERNNLSHPGSPETFIKVSDSKLNAYMTDLRALYTRILELAGKKGSVKQRDVDTAVKTMEKELEDERHSESGINDSQFLDLSLQDLEKYAHSFKSVASEYVKVRLALEIQKNHNPSEIPLKDLLGQICKDGSKPKVIIVAGETGAGKTSLCQYVMTSWLSSTTTLVNLDQYQLVITFHCGSVNTRDLNYLLSSKILPLATLACDSGALTRIMTRLTVLWLVDGWDEATQEARALLEELFNKLSLRDNQQPLHTVLITSRPELSAGLTADVVRTDRLLRASLLGLDSGEKEEFLKRKESELASKGSKRSISTFIEHMASLRGLVLVELKNPLKLLLMARLWCENIEFQPESSLIKLYMNIKDTLIKQLVDKLRATAAPADHDAQELIEKWFRCFCKVAFNSVKDAPVLRLDPRDLKQLKEECRDVRESPCLSTFLTYHPGSKGKDYYKYLHYSEQCFYAALHVTSTCSQARDPQAEMNDIFDAHIRESDRYINQYLGIFDIFNDFLILFMITVSKLSFGWIFSRMKSKELYKKLLQLIRKLINLVSGRYSTQNTAHDDSNINKYHAVLLQLLEMRALKYFTANIPAACLGNLLFLSLNEEGDPIKWFQVLHSCHYEEDLVREVARRVDMNLWNVTDGDLKAAWALLRLVTPKELVLNIMGDPKELLDLPVLLLLVAERRVKVRLFIRWHYGSCGLKDSSDEYLSLLCDGTTKCSMVSFMGHLSSSSISSLTHASWMKHLSLRVTDDHTVDALCSVTHKLRRLQALDLVYDLRKYTTPCSSLDGSFGILKFIDSALGGLTLQGSTSLNVSLTLPHLPGSLVTRAVDFISGLSSRYRILSVSRLDHKEVKKLLVGLENKHVCVANLIKPVFFKQIDSYIPVSICSLPLQVPLKDVVQTWHDIDKNPPDILMRINMS